MPTAPSPARSAFRRSSTSPVPSNGRSTGRPRSTASSSPIATPCPPPKAAPTRPGSGPPILKGIRAYGELVNNRKAADITRDDLTTGGCALISVFIRDPSFVGQTKDRLSTEDAARLVENAVRDHFDNWLASDTKSAGAILDFLVLRAEERLRRRQEKETARKTATKKLRLPGKLVDCSATNREGTELFIVEGDSAGGSAKMARDRKNQALLPLRGKILNVLGAASSKLGTNTEISDLCQALGVGMGTKFRLDDLRYDKIIIMTDADVDGAHIAALLMTFFFSQMRPMIDAGHLYLACPPLYRLTQGATPRLLPRRGRARRVDGKGSGRQGQDRRLPLQGPGRDGRQGPERHHDEPRNPQADPGVASTRTNPARPAIWSSA